MGKTRRGPSYFLAAILPAAALFNRASALAGSPAPGPGASQVLEKDFTMHFRAPALEPGLGEASQELGEAMTAGDAVWTSSTQGRMAASLWLKKAVVSFDVSRGTGSIIDVDLGGRGSPSGGGEGVWRQQHGYRAAGQGYVWMTIFGEAEEPMDAALGAGYDEVLSGVWRLWAKRSLERKLAGSPVSGMPAQGAEELNKSIAMRYDGAGLVGTASGDYVVRVWHIPVRVRFSIKSAQPDELSDWIIQLADLQVDYDKYKDEWRKRYGYSLSSSGGYAWDADFPDPKPDIASFGPKMDDLMKRCVLYWAHASVASIMEGLDAQLKNAAARARVPAAGTPPGQAQSELIDIQDQGAWPR